MLRLTLLVADARDAEIEAALRALSTCLSAAVGHQVLAQRRMTRATDPAGRMAASVELEDWNAVLEVGRTGCIEAFVADLTVSLSSLAIVVRKVSTGAETRVGSPQRILVVDDEPSLRRLLALILTADGHTVLEAASAAEARSILAIDQFETVVSDLHMPRGDGFAVADAVARRSPSARFIIASGLGRDIDPLAALARQVSVVLSKPFSIAELREAVLTEE